MDGYDQCDQDADQSEMRSNIPVIEYLEKTELCKDCGHSVTLHQDTRLILHAIVQPLRVIERHNKRHSFIH